MKDPRQHPLQAFLECSPEYLAADEAELFAVCNGCGAAGAKADLVPDTIWGLDIKAACFSHDWEYHKGKTQADKHRADLRLLNNLLTLIDMAPGWHNRLLRMPRRRRALKYYEAVNRFGNKAFWANKPAQFHGEQGSP